MVDEDDALCSQSALVIVKQKSPEEDATVILAEEEGIILINYEVIMNCVD